jgi:hypothetical protein
VLGFLTAAGGEHSRRGGRDQAVGHDTIFGALLAGDRRSTGSIERIPFFRPLAWLGAGLALVLGSLSLHTITMQGRMSETATRVTVIGTALAMALLAPPDQARAAVALAT